MQPRLICALLAVAPFSLLAQEPHAADTPGNAPAAAPAAPGGAPRGNAKGGGGRGGRGGDAALPPADLIKIMAEPAELAKGRKAFEARCIECHGPFGEGSRGPTLAQPNLPRASDDASLMRIIQSGIPGTEMAGQRLPPGELPLVAAYVRSLGRLPVEVVPGDPARGAALFNTKGACMTCHTLAGKGVAAIGPDLTDVGRRRSAAFLRRSLVDPGADVPQSATPLNEAGQPTNFLFVRAKTRDGKEVAGVRVNENTYSIQMRDLTGKVHSYFKSELAELHKDKGVSPMPVYTAVFTPAEMDDILAYLVSLRGEKK